MGAPDIYTVAAVVLVTEVFEAVKVGADSVVYAKIVEFALEVAVNESNTVEDS